MFDQQIRAVCHLHYHRWLQKLIDLVRHLGPSLPIRYRLLWMNQWQASIGVEPKVEPICRSIHLHLVQ